MVGIDGSRTDETAFDLIASPCVGTGAGSALATTGEGGVAGLGIGSTIRGAGFGVVRAPCEVACLEGPAGGCGRSGCRLVTWRDDTVVVFSTGLGGGKGAVIPSLEGTPSFQVNLYSSTLNPVSHNVSIISLTPLQPFSSLIPLATFFLPLQKSAKPCILLNKFLGM